MDAKEFEFINKVVIVRYEDKYEKMVCDIFLKNRKGVPYYYPETSIDSWRDSFFHDKDFDGKPLFKELETYLLIIDNLVEGWIQFGLSSFVFAGNQKDYSKSYGIIRDLYFNNHISQNHILDLLKMSENYFAKYELKTIYAYFHYFGMSCYSRQGKLHESEFYIEDILVKNKYVIEHENIYYAKLIEKEQSKDQDLKLTFSKDNTNIDFVLNEEVIGQCIINYIKTSQRAFMRWIGIKKEYRERGYGSRYLNCLLHYLSKEGYRYLETDTASNNIVAQNFYNRNGFVNKGIMRSYIKEV